MRISKLFFIPLSLLSFILGVSSFFLSLHITAERQSLDDARVRFTPVAELLHRELLVVVLVHLVEDLVNALLRRVVVVWVRLLALQS